VMRTLKDIKRTVVASSGSAADPTTSTTVIEDTEQGAFA
jgi:hypothetical protein